MKQEYWKILFYIFIIAFLFWLGFFIGRKTIYNNEPKIEIVYKDGTTIHDTVKIFEPFDVIKPIDTLSIIKQCIENGIYAELFPEKTITEYIEITKEDTSAILLDWATKRLYSETLFDSDTLGKFIIDAEIQYNRVSYLNYLYTPKYKEITILTNKKKYFSPFVGCGVLICLPYNNMAFPSLNAGFFIKEKYGLNLQYGRNIDNQKNLYGISFYYKF